MTQTTEMVERVANVLWESRRAQWQACGDGVPLPLLKDETPALQELLRNEARAAILAMREPTEAMVLVGKEVMWRDDMAADVWRSMIDAALATREPDPTLTAGALA